MSTVSGLIPLPDLKTPLFWALGVGLVAALVGLGVQRVELADAARALSDEHQARAEENATRARAALRDAQKTAEAEKQHATDQQGIVHELNQTKAALVVVDAGRRDLAGRLHDTAGELAAARYRLQASGDAAACGDTGDQRATLFGLLEEAGRLSARSGELAGEGASLLEQRDAEVKALKGMVDADRALMVRAADQGAPAPSAPSAASGAEGDGP